MYESVLVKPPQQFPITFFSFIFQNVLLKDQLHDFLRDQSKACSYPGYFSPIDRDVPQSPRLFLKYGLPKTSASFLSTAEWNLLVLTVIVDSSSSGHSPCSWILSLSSEKTLISEYWDKSNSWFEPSSSASVWEPFLYVPPQWEPLSSHSLPCLPLL